MKNALRLSTLALALILSGCGEKSTDELIQSATKFQTEKNLSAAIIELKTAIQQDPTNSEARLLLGRIYLQQGNGLGAEKELMRALQNGTAFKNLAIDIAATSYISGKDIDNKLFKSDDPSWKEAKPYVDSFRSLYLFDNGEIDELSQHLTSMAELENPSDAVALRNAINALLSKDLVKTDSFLKQIDPQSPLYRDSRLLLAKSEMSQGLFSEAATTLQKYLEMTPLANYAKLMLAECQVRDDKFDQAATTLQPILKQFPEQPFANYIMALVSYQKNDFIKSKEYAEKALNNGFTAPNVRILAALASLKQGLDTQALSHLRAVKAYLSTMPPLQKLHAMLELKDGNVKYASEVLSNTSVTNEDIQLMSSATYEILRQGDVDSARKLIEHIEKNVDKNVENLATLGMLKMNLGDFKQDGLQNLEQVLALNPKANESRLALALGYINSQKFDEASAIAKEWLTDPSTASLGYTIQAYSAFFQKNYELAKKISLSSLEAEPKNIQLQLLLARIAMLENDRPLATQWISKALANDPNFVATLKLNYTVNRNQSGVAEATDLIKNAEEKNPGSNELKLLHAAVLIDQEKFQPALDLIEKIDSKTIASESKYWLLKSIAHQGRGNMTAAITAIEDWLKIQPQNPEAKLSLVRLNAATNNFGTALQLLNDLVKKFPENIQLKGMKLILLVETGDVKGANALISSLPTERQNSAEVLFLQSKILITEKKFTDAIKTLEKSYQKTPNPEAALLLSDLYARNVSPEKAVSFIENHFSTQPPNANLKAMYANLLVNLSPEKAINNFRELLKEDDENVLALNNLAYVYIGLNKLDEAETYASKALKLMPNHPDILDTYGKVMLAKGDIKTAIKHFQASLKLRNNQPEVQLNYAEALLKNNQKAEAKDLATSVITTDEALMKRKTSLLSQM
jgi:cellulose synthase operon protein C